MPTRGSTATNVALSKPVANAPWVDTSILVGSLIFMSGLAISAYFAPQWRVLHVLQGSIYIVVILMTRRLSAWGFGAGALLATFWNCLVLFRSPVGTGGIKAIETVLRGGPPDPSTLIQLFAACGHFLIIGACVAGFLRLRPTGRQWGEFVGGGVLAVGFLLLMAFTVGPPEAAVNLKRAFGL
jgi:hypothetical protein